MGIWKLRNTRPARLTRAYSCARWRCTSLPARGRKDGDHGPPYSEARDHMLERHHRQTLWIYWLLLILGAWMVASPLTFDYRRNIVAPSGGRELWLSDDLRVWAMIAGDALSGLLLIAFGRRALRPNPPISLWICCLVGIWLTFAPKVFCAPTGAAYLNSTLVGALVIALTVLIPDMPEMMPSNPGLHPAAIPATSRQTRSSALSMPVSLPSGGSSLALPATLACASPANRIA